MQIEQLTYVVEVAKSASISKAAARLHISQSAISQSITNLEKNLGTQLFVRSKHGTIPTQEGKRFIKKAQHILLKIDELKHELQTEPINGILRLSASPGHIRFIIKTLKSFREDYPNIVFEIEEKDSSLIMKDLHQNKADLGLPTLYNDLIMHTKNIEYNILLNSTLKTYVHPESPLALNDTIALEELKDIPLVLYKSKLGDKFVRDFKERYGSINLLFTSNSTDAIKKSILEGLAISVVPDFCLNEDPQVINGEIIPLNFSDYSGASISFGWVRSKLYAPSLPALKFIEYLNDQFSQEKGSETKIYKITTLRGS